MSKMNYRYGRPITQAFSSIFEDKLELECAKSHGKCTSTFSMLYAQEKYVHVFGQAVTPLFLEAILRREAFGHASKQGSFRTVSSSGSGGRTPNLN